MVINAILLSNDGLHVVSSGWDGRVIMWETATGSKVCPITFRLILESNLLKMNNETKIRNSISSLKIGCRIPM